jgi:DNA-binding NtrC family response regulator
VLVERELSVGQNPPRRKVLIIEDEPSIHNVLYALLSGLDCEGEVAHNDRQALAMISRDSYDAVLLDLRWSKVPAERMVSQIKEIRPSLLGRVLVITSEVGDPRTIEAIERQCVPHLSRNRMVNEFWNWLRPILGGSKSPETVR